MSESSIAITTGVDLNLHGDSRTVSAATRHAQYFLLGWPSAEAAATYSVIARNISVATTADHILQVMGDGTNYSRLIRYRIQTTDDVPAAATLLDFQIYRLSTAGTGGSSVTPRPFDESDSAYGGGAMTLPSSKGTEGVLLNEHRVPVNLSHPFQPLAGTWTWEESLRGKPIIFGTGTTNGIAFKIVTGVASCTVDIIAEFVVSSYR